MHRALSLIWNVPASSLKKSSWGTELLSLHLEAKEKRREKLGSCCLHPRLDFLQATLSRGPAPFLLPHLGPVSTEGKKRCCVFLSLGTARSLLKSHCPLRCAHGGVSRRCWGLSLPVCVWISIRKCVDALWDSEFLEPWRCVCRDWTRRQNSSSPSCPGTL